MIKWMEQHKLIGISVLLIIFYVHQTSALYFAKDESLPGRVYFLKKGAQVKRGDVVGIKHHDTKYLKGLHFTKILLGLPGDSIEIKGNRLLVGGFDAGVIRKTTNKGLPLTPISNKKIPQGYVFVMSHHQHSYDSRYQEFGLVSLSKIQGRMVTLW